MKGVTALSKHKSNYQFDLINFDGLEQKMYFSKQIEKQLIPEFLLFFKSLQ